MLRAVVRRGATSPASLRRSSPRSLPKDRSQAAQNPFVDRRIFRPGKGQPARWDRAYRQPLPRTGIFVDHAVVVTIGQRTALRLGSGLSPGGCWEGRRYRDAVAILIPQRTSRQRFWDRDKVSRGSRGHRSCIRRHRRWSTSEGRGQPLRLTRSGSEFHFSLRAGIDRSRGCHRPDRLRADGTGHEPRAQRANIQACQADAKCPAQPRPRTAPDAKARCECAPISVSRLVKSRRNALLPVTTVLSSSSGPDGEAAIQIGVAAAGRLLDLRSHGDRLTEQCLGEQSRLSPTSETCNTASPAMSFGEKR